ncbi:MAG: type II toxin-antitoxin system HicA family toxin [Acidobacteria bacterium]|nr:type II toxin-antitoxin system HicA family toxin [Acidobacteriota bacterium]
MGKLPVLKPREVAARLESLGFAEIRQRGSHKQYRHPDGRERQFRSTLLRHFPNPVAKIAKDIGLTAEQLLGRT